MGEIIVRLRQLNFINRIRQLIPDKVVNYLYHLPLAFLAVLYYRYPASNLKVIGVTGTDGKTTTATLIFNILKKAGFKTALISTVSAKIGKRDLPTGFHVTSPDPWELQRILRLISDQDFDFLVLESTSHGLDQFRLLGCNFKIGVITNVTHEHLDYHKTWENYLKAKAKLFGRTEYSILNKDDRSFQRLRRLASGKIITYGFKKADLTPKEFPFKTSLPGDFNQYNLLAAVAAAKILEIDDQVIRQAIAEFKGVVGRMDEVKMGQNFRAFIDFAHTPNGLKNSLKTLKSFKPRKLIAVFGAAGLRDRTKRPMMGKIACFWADKVILTAEDPRTEDVNQIIEQIASGCKIKSKIIRESDRRKAINLAIMMAKKGDIVGIFGKGHEKSLCFGIKEYPWSEHKVVKKALKRRLKNV